MVGQHLYDIIFMDHMMPEMDGIEAANKIRSLECGDGYNSNVPIIALTANAVAGMEEIFLQNGMNDFLAKPIEMSKLNRILKKWIPKEKREKYTGDKAQLETEECSINGIDVKTGIAITGRID